MAEAVRFELTDLLQSSVFKTDTLNHSDTQTEIEYVSCSVAKYAGMQKFDVEVLDRTSPAFFDELVRLMANAYAKATDTAMVTALQAGTLDSLLMYGQAFWQITEVYAEDGRMARANWVANTKVGFITDPATNFVTQYNIDGKPVPMTGLGSLITFQKDEGILGIGARTIQSALDVQRAAAIAAATPMNSGIIKNSGADLPPSEITALLAAWKRSRTNNATAYLTSTLNYEPTSFSPKDMMYNEAIQNLATECARLCSVDPYYVSASQNTTMTYANVQDERKQMVALTLQPYASAIEARLSMDDISTAGHYVKFNLDDTFLRTEPMERLLVLEKMLALGLITTEQAMEMESLSPNGNGE